MSSVVPPEFVHSVTLFAVCDSVSILIRNANSIAAMSQQDKWKDLN